MYKIILYVFLLFSYSCALQKPNEYIELKHRNYVVIKSDEIIVKLIPSNIRAKKSVIVKIIYHGESLDRKRISIEKYNEIKSIILQTKQEDIELPKSDKYLVAIMDCGQNSISLKDNNIEKELHTCGMIQKYHGKFYMATELILKAIKMDITDVD